MGEFFGLERLIRCMRTRKFLFFGAAAATSIAFGYGIRRRIESGRIREFMDEWREEISPKRNVLVYCMSEIRRSQIARKLLGEGYGVLLAESSAQADQAVMEANGLAAAVTDDRSWNPSANFIPRVNFSNAKNIELIIAASENAAYEPLREVAGYLETAGGREFHEAPLPVERALSELIKNTLIVQKSNYDARSGGVIYFLPSGKPLRKKEHYVGDAFCIKVEAQSGRSLDDLICEIKDDSNYFGSSSAKPFFYAGISGNAVIVWQYFIGPTLADAVAVLKSDLPKEIADEAVRKTLGAVFSITAEYHKHKKTGTPRSGAILNYYRKNLAGAYEEVGDLASLIGLSTGLFSKSSSVLYAPELNGEVWYGRIIDTLLPNMKISMGIERPSPDKIVAEFVRNGEVLGESEIRKKIRIYDLPYKDRHFVDEFVRAAFYADLGEIDRKNAVAYAKAYLRKEYSVQLPFGIPLTEQLIDRLIGINPEIRPDDFAVNFFVISSYKLFRFIADCMNCAKGNEHAYATGQISRDEYETYRESYLSNATTYGKSLELISMAGAVYFSGGISGSLWKRMDNALEKAASLDAEYASFSGSLSQNLAYFSLIGRRIAVGRDAMAMILEGYVKSLPFSIIRPSSIN